ncbi:pantetheine-phosphate adenylyltransferase [Candidatus Stoquefichus sp. SB1]|jgi:pantetheine-phosphate adenylyltransferase|uniref:pantetheine-phosphate adenylyltransferase n=1 Tax=Candidatus Stoquefichus sp. SB1 TaxID=1658109 RepID=UPI00067EDAC4|nr:pantetheine-phosphate adenylyltransferase [Candidatus Stoquefichus sp. SB1]
MKAVYAGTFDPVTNGHLDIIERASRMYEHLYVTIFDNPAKQTMFDLQERLSLLKAVTEKFDNVTVDYSSALAVEYAKELGASILVRGLRATMDFEYELQLAFSNQYLDDSVDMVFLMTRPNHSYISSSSVKEIASHHHSVEGLVPDVVEKALKTKINE